MTARLEGLGAGNNYVVKPGEAIAAVVLTREAESWTSGRVIAIWDGDIVLFKKGMLVSNVDGSLITMATFNPSERVLRRFDLEAGQLLGMSPKQVNRLKLLRNK